MTTRTIDEILKARDQIRMRFKDAMADSLKEKPSKPEETLAELERMVKRQEERVLQDKRTMKETLDRFEGQIKQREARIAELRKVSEALRRVEADKRGPSKPLKKEGGKPPLEEVAGIGPVAANKLRHGGFSTVEMLSGASPSKIALVLEITEAKAKKLISRAKKLIKEWSRES